MSALCLESQSGIWMSTLSCVSTAWRAATPESDNASGWERDRHIHENQRDEHSRIRHGAESKHIARLGTEGTKSQQKGPVRDGALLASPYHAMPPPGLEPGTY